MERKTPLPMKNGKPYDWEIPIARDHRHQRDSEANLIIGGLLGLFVGAPLYRRGHFGKVIVAGAVLRLFVGGVGLAMKHKETLMMTYSTVRALIELKRSQSDAPSSTP